ncbi:bifunctional folylpolyglutamate synthase/dihydrofolate synthase [Salipaludibacillus keqinensis]|nr:folylpolyglutamate synthase/dihydrofolate synthase family protein [Salipaludibacillus keqinensis]
MITNMEDARLFIESKQGAGIVYTLDRMQALMTALDHPEKKIKAIHVAGTNGKGSTCAFLSSILQEAGYKVGAFNTPVFGDAKDQITINQYPVSDEEFVLACREIEGAVSAVEYERKEMVSEFECFTALTYYYFAFIQPIDVVLVEAGMGGRLDATNVLDEPVCTIITNVGLDHQRYLGDSIKSIAKEKAGIIKPKVPLFTASQGDALEQLVNVGIKKCADVISLFDNVKFKTEKINNSEQLFTYDDSEVNQHYTIRLLGEHQTVNASLSLMVVHYLSKKIFPKIHEEHIQKGLMRAFIPGRWEVVQEHPTVIMDTAHNIEAIHTVCQLTRRKYTEQNVTVLFAAMKDKPVKEMLALLRQLNCPIVYTTFDSDRSMTKEDYKLLETKKLTEEMWIKDYKLGIEQWIKAASDTDVLIITGSHQFISECRQNIRKSSN